MIIIFESLFVGLYCLFLYTILGNLNIKLNKYYFLFIFGFLKHFLSYYFGIHDYYCNNGYACNNYNNSKKKSDTKYLIFDSILEGFLFIVVGHYIFNCFKNKYLGFFVIGVFLHLSAELFFIHTFFCNYRCIKI
jgi:hypothetical protein